MAYTYAVYLAIFQTNCYVDGITPEHTDVPMVEISDSEPVEEYSDLVWAADDDDDLVMEEPTADVSLPKTLPFQTDPTDSDLLPLGFELQGKLLKQLNEKARQHITECMQAICNYALLERRLVHPPARAHPHDLHQV